MTKQHHKLYNVMGYNMLLFSIQSPRYTIAHGSYTMGWIIITKITVPCVYITLITAPCKQKL